MSARNPVTPLRTLCPHLLLSSHGFSPLSPLGRGRRGAQKPALRKLSLLGEKDHTDRRRGRVGVSECARLGRKTLGRAGAGSSGEGQGRSGSRLSTWGPWGKGRDVESGENRAQAQGAARAKAGRSGLCVCGKGTRVAGAERPKEGVAGLRWAGRERGPQEWCS